MRQIAPFHLSPQAERASDKRRTRHFDDQDGFACVAFNFKSPDGKVRRYVALKEDYERMHTAQVAKATRKREAAKAFNSTPHVFGLNWVSKG